MWAKAFISGYTFGLRTYHQQLFSHVLHERYRAAEIVVHLRVAQCVTQGIEIHQSLAVMVAFCHIVCSRLSILDVAVQMWHASGDICHFAGSKGVNGTVFCHVQPV